MQTIKLISTMIAIVFMVAITIVSYYIAVLFLVLVGAYIIAKSYLWLTNNQLKGD